ncbi:MAG TPA: serine/threonine-protein kinase [Noviherbaspirillum sp.]
MNFPTTEFSPASAPAVSRIGRFYVIRELGRGTTGCVYLAHDPVIGRDIAVKTLNPRLSPIERTRYERQFVNEARAAGLLSHPHIITIHDACMEHGAPYIAMEYLQGRELEILLGSGRRFKPDETAYIILKIAEALDHAHRREVIHRDIKPANIFIANDNQPKLVDFGIAQVPSRGLPEDAAPAKSQSNNLAGTPNYMSPEQALGRKVDARTDIYSLGAVMYEMLAGRKPFQSDETEKLLHLVASKAPDTPHDVDSKVPIVLSDIAMKAMNKRPERRYQTAQEMALDLKRYLAGERRARRRMKMRVPGLDRIEAGETSPQPSLIYWAGAAYLALTVMVTGIALRL